MRKGVNETTSVLVPRKIDIKSLCHISYYVQHRRAIRQDERGT